PAGRPFDPKVLGEVGQLEPGVDKHAVGMRGPDEARVIERIAGVEGPGRRVDGPNAVMPPRHDELLDADVRPESRIEEHLEVIAAESGGQPELAPDVVAEIGAAFAGSA